MKKTPLYQAVDGNRQSGNVAKPILCMDDEAWLGSGYYFWDNSLESAEWWGKEHYHSNFFINRSYYDYHSDEYLDLVGNTKHRKYIKNRYDILVRRRHDTYTVGELIEILKQKDPDFPFLAVRALPIPSNVDSKQKIFYDQNNEFYFDANEKIQMCVIELSFLLNGEYRMIYPETSDPNCAV